MESIEMEIPDSKKEEEDLMKEFNTFSGHAIDDQVMKICHDFEFEIEVNGEMKKANELINLMDQASQLNQKALFECSTEELKEKVENNWDFNVVKVETRQRVKTFAPDEAPARVVAMMKMNAFVFDPGGGC